MKKVMLLATLVLTSLSCLAQDIDIDETDLFGRWVQTSKSGEFTSYKKYERDPDYSVQAPEAFLFYDEPNLEVVDDSLGVAYYCDPHYAIMEYNQETWEWEPTGEYGEYWEYAGIRDYFISKNNTLHIYLWGTHYALRYKIIGFDGTTLTLQTMNGKGVITFSKEVTSAVRAIEAAPKATNRYYSIDGRLLNGEPRTGVFIKNKRKYIK